MKKYVLFIKNHRRHLALIIVIINLLSIYGLTQITISGDFKIFIPEVSKNQDLLKEMDSLFPASDQIIYMIPLESTMNFDSYKTLHDLESYLSSLAPIDRLRGPAPDSITIGSNTITVERDNPTSIVQLNMYYDLLGQLSPVISHEGETYALFTLFINDSFTAKTIHQIEKKMDDLQLTYYATGDSYMQLLIFDYITRILMFIPPIALFFILVIFKTQLQSIKATALSLLPAGMGALWTMGLIGLSGLEVSIVTVLSPIFTIVIGSADGLHFISHVQDEEDAGYDNISSLVKTLSIVGKPMIITTITSMVGFLALLTMNTNAIKDLALFASLGILLAGLITWLVLPLILTGKTKLHRHKKNKTITFSPLKKLWGLPALIILLLGFIIFAFGLPRVKTEFNMLMVYKESTNIYKNTVKIQEINGGSIPVYLYGQSDRNPLYKETAFQLMDLSQELTESSYVSKILSPYQIIETIVPFILPNINAYPDSNELIDQMTQQLTSLENSPMNELINSNENAVKMVIFPKSLDNKTLQGIKSIVDKFNKNNPSIQLETTGIQYMMMDLNDSMFDNQIVSTSLALLVVFILLLISLRTLKPALISLIPITVTTLFLFGFLGISGISLNILTTTIFSITIGVGIDYAIHFTSVFIHLRHEGLEPSSAAEKAYQYSGRPIIANALGLALGFTSLLLSPLQIHANITILMWVTMIISVFFSLTFLPTALVFTSRHQK